jgi:hypothetical protein
MLPNPVSAFLNSGGNRIQGLIIANWSKPYFLSGISPQIQCWLPYGTKFLLYLNQTMSANSFQFFDGWGYGSPGCLVSIWFPNFMSSNLNYSDVAASSYVPVKVQRIFNDSRNIREFVDVSVPASWMADLIAGAYYIHGMSSHSCSRDLNNSNNT